MKKHRKIAIIGAGVAGLATAKTLLRRGYACVLFERADRLGGVWAAGYSNFGTQVQRELYEFPDWPLPRDVADFTPGPIVRDYLEGYAKHFGVWAHIVFEAAVTDVARDPAGTGWRVEYARHGQALSEGFDFVVVCTGLYSNRPHLPRFPGQEGFAGEIMHVSALADRSRLAGRKVAVLGFGKSATDAALESSAVAAETSIIFRQPHWPVPPRLLNILPFKWAMLNRLTSTLIPLHYRPSTLERCVHTLGKPLVWAWWRIVEWLLIAQYGLGSRGGTRTSLVPAAPIEYDAFGESVMLPRPAFYRQLRSGEITPIQAEIKAFTAHGMELTNGDALAVDTVVLATGWETDYSWLSAETKAALGFADDGLYLYRQMVHPAVKDLAFVGYASTITSVLTYNLQARWLADLLDERHALPPDDDMRRNIEAQQAWKRRIMPPSKGRAARLLLHMLHYHDELLEDLGESPLRKRGPFAPFKEVFAPYEPGDYRGVVD
jgi:dimethylaniline monooxygenase (N-oxide forming)